MASYLQIWKQVLINRSDRPVLDSDETSIYARDGIGLYQGKEKIANCQNGRIYLTSKRLIYVDNETKKNSMSVLLNHLKSAEAIPGFLNSSAKVKLFINKELNESPLDPIKPVDWICPICSFNNQFSQKMTADTSLPPCVSCGIKPPRLFVEKLKKKDPEVMVLGNICPRCTFENHLSMAYCEMCGTELRSALPDELKKEITGELGNIAKVNIKTETYTNNEPYIKVSFHEGGLNVFKDKMNEALEALKWEKLTRKGEINKNGKLLTEEPVKLKVQGGILGLQQVNEQKQKQNEIIIRGSLEDLEQLMHQSEELIKLSKSFGKLVKDGKTINVGLIPPFTVSKNSNIYHKELARYISEYLVNYELTKNSSVLSAQDIFANLNRYMVLTRGFGTELINHEDYNKSVAILEELTLPVQVRRYNESGLVVLCLKSSHDYGTFIVKYLQELEYNFFYEKFKQEIEFHSDDNDYQDGDHYLSEKFDFFKGETISGISTGLNWSYSITAEEIDNLIQTGAIVVDENFQGTFYYVNTFFNQSSINELEIKKKVQEALVAEQKAITDHLRLKHMSKSHGALIDFAPDYQFGRSEALHEPSPSLSLNDLIDLNL